MITSMKNKHGEYFREDAVWLLIDKYGADWAEVVKLQNKVEGSTWRKMGKSMKKWVVKLTSKQLLLEDYLQLVQFEKDEKAKIDEFKGDKNSNATTALVEALNVQYDLDTKRLKGKVLDLAIIKKDTLAFRSLLESALQNFKGDEKIQSAADAIAAVWWYKRFLGYLRAGKISFAWSLIIVLVTIVVIAAPIFLRKEIQALWAFLTFVIGAGSWVWSLFADEIKRVKKLTEDIDNARQLEGDIENGKSDKMTKLKHDIDVLEKRLWVKKGESLDDVVRNRLDSGGYADQLGVVHKAQEDSQRLSDALLNKSYHAKKIFPRGDPRIVLFIDDLDRCPPDKVVEMLEALQLLVKTKLFVVVVSIDMRFVTLALEKHYTGILEAGRNPSGLDYLEKIIQLPYRLPPVDKQTAIHRYIKSKMGLLKKDELPVDPPEAKQEDEEKKDDEMKDDEMKDEEDKENKDQQDEENKDQPDDRKKEKEMDESATTAVSQSVLKMVPIAFAEAENQMLADACSAASVNPRSIRRLVNVLKLMKLIWHQQKATQEAPDEKLKRACVFFLAMCASKSNTLLRGMRAIFDEMETSMDTPEQSNLKEFVDEARLQEQQFSKVFRSTRHWQQFRWTLTWNGRMQKLICGWSDVFHSLDRIQKKIEMTWRTWRPNKKRNVISRPNKRGNRIGGNGIFLVIITTVTWRPNKKRNMISRPNKRGNKTAIMLRPNKRRNRTAIMTTVILTMRVVAAIIAAVILMMRVISCTHR